MQRYHVLEMGNADHHMAHAHQAAELFARLEATPMLARWLDPNDPDDPATSLRHARRACGHWLVVRQLWRSLSMAEVVRQTGLSTQTWLLLTLGGASPEAVSPEAGEMLSELLHDATHDAELLTAVVDVACGRSDDEDGVVVERVMRDLEDEYDDTIVDE